MANDYIRRLDETYELGVRNGAEIGRQQIVDMISLVLRDEKIMGKDTFGKARLLKLLDGILGYLEIFEPAWVKSDDADYWQEKLDQALKQAYGTEGFDNFKVRYPLIKQKQYGKKRK